VKQALQEETEILSTIATTKDKEAEIASAMLLRTSCFFLKARAYANLGNAHSLKGEMLLSNSNSRGSNIGEKRKSNDRGTADFKASILALSIGTDSVNKCSSDDRESIELSSMIKRWAAVSHWHLCHYKEASALFREEMRMKVIRRVFFLFLLFCSSSASSLFCKHIYYSLAKTLFLLVLSPCVLLFN
jgi:hypothetical protein